MFFDPSLALGSKMSSFVSFIAFTVASPLKWCTPLIS